MSEITEITSENIISVLLHDLYKQNKTLQDEMNSIHNNDRYVSNELYQLKESIDKLTEKIDNIVKPIDTNFCNISINHDDIFKQLRKINKVLKINE